MSPLPVVLPNDQVGRSVLSPSPPTEVGRSEVEPIARKVGGERANGRSEQKAEKEEKMEGGGRTITVACAKAQGYEMYVGEGHWIGRTGKRGGGGGGDMWLRQSGEIGNGKMGFGRISVLYLRTE